MALHDAVTTEVETLPGSVTVVPSPGCVIVCTEVETDPGAVTVVAHWVIGPIGVSLGHSYVTTDV